MARVLPRRATVGRSKRQLQWVGSADQGFVAIGANASVLHQSNGTLAGTTIVRTRGGFSVIPASRDVDLEVIGAIGMGIVSAQAFIAGAASIPGPFSDADWSGWLYWSPFQYLFESTTDIGRLILGTTGAGAEVIDSKAMRKVQANEVLVVMVESQAGAFLASINFRMLLKLG